MNTKTRTTLLDEGPVVERPGGFYWRDEASGAEFGPFRTRAEALDDMERNDGEDADLDTEDEALREAEDEIGIADWIDPDTGLPAEESVPHIEDH